MYKICLILPYFGTLPNYFSHYLSSCSHNENVDFLIITDQEIICDAQNVKIVHKPWEEFQHFVKSRLGSSISIDAPYKLCDYKPAYGYIFEQFLVDYDFWGHCDCDLIWGDLDVLQSKLSNTIDRFGEYGHLILYRNDAKVNQYFRSLQSSKVPSWETVSGNSKIFGFDEFGGMNVLFAENTIAEKHDRLFDDIIFYRKNFFTRREIPSVKDNARVPMYFSFRQGKLYRNYYLNSEWHRDESLYVHFQKRPLCVECSDVDDFDIVPNRIVKASSMSSNELLSLTRPPLLDTTYIKMMMRYYISQLVKPLRK